MSTKLADPPLERLSAGGLGPMLERANREFAANIDEGAAFRRLAERMDRPTFPAFRGMKLALALGLVGVLVAVLQKALSSGSGPVITAEPARPPAVLRGERRERGTQPAPTHANAPPLATPARPAPETPPSEPAGRPPLEPPRSAGALPEARSASAPSSPPAPSASPEIEGPDCLSLARAGSTRAAESCFLKRADGTGLGAEMALYEVARLRRDVLADPSGALEALAAYRRRFPAGSLRREADVSQLELLMQVGRSEDALRQTQELLSSSASGERAGELHLLRGHIFRKNLRDVRAAEREYALAEQAPGASRVEASYFRATCLQALGENAAALAAYERYLEKGGRNYASEAKKRMETLTP